VAGAGSVGGVGDGAVMFSVGAFAGGGTAGVPISLGAS
jgi:hypothetical protein